MVNHNEIIFHRITDDEMKGFIALKQAARYFIKKAIGTQLSTHETYALIKAFTAALEYTENHRSK